MPASAAPPELLLKFAVDGSLACGAFSTEDCPENTCLSFRAYRGTTHFCEPQTVEHSTREKRQVLSDNVVDAEWLSFVGC
jgi:hypothetical protein